MEQATSNKTPRKAHRKIKALVQKIAHIENVLARAVARGVRADVKVAQRRLLIVKHLHHQAMRAATAKPRCQSQ